MEAFQKPVVSAPATQAWQPPPLGWLGTSPRRPGHWYMALPLPGQVQPGEWSLAAVPATYLPLFPGMSDFQYLAVHTEVGGVHRSMYDKVLMVRPEKEDFFHQELPLCIPPPIFSRLDTPADYFYRPETQHR